MAAMLLQPGKSTKGVNSTGDPKDFVGTSLNGGRGLKLETVSSDNTDFSDRSQDLGQRG